MYKNINKILKIIDKIATKTLKNFDKFGKIESCHNLNLGWF